VDLPPNWVDELSRAWRREHPRLDTSTLPPLVRLARLVLLGDAFQRAVLAPFELSIGDYSVLAVLRRAGRPYALSPSELYGRLQRSSGGMTKILKRLEDQGFIRRSPDPDDGRGSRVHLTKAGLELQERVFQAFLSASQDLFAGVPAARRRDLDRALRALVEAFEAYVGG
jgi:DNA-binding MarR family transcriptional regulator